MSIAPKPIILWQMPPIWGLPNPSPFCMKLETWLRMSGLPYEAKAITGPPKSKSGKIPYIERSDGTFLGDSTTIIETLTREHGVDLDAELTPRQRAESVLLQRTFEEHLYFLVLHERWVDDAGWSVCGRDYFATLPAPLRLVLPPIIRREVKRNAVGQGLSRLTDDERVQRARRDIESISTFLGDQEFFFGRPSTIDAVAHGFLANCVRVPFDAPVSREVKKLDNLVAYDKRMTERYWKGWKPA
jgi:glutathione S-transferase